MAGANSRFAVVTEEGILKMFTFLECVVNEFVYADTIILFSLGELWLLEH